MTEKQNYFSQALSLDEKIQEFANKIEALQLRIQKLTKEYEKLLKGTNNQGIE